MHVKQPSLCLVRVGHPEKVSFLVSFENPVLAKKSPSVWYAPGLDITNYKSVESQRMKCV